MSVLDFIKHHPYGTAIGAAALVGGFILLRGSGSNNTPAGTTVDQQAMEVQQGTALQAAQIAANAQSHQVDQAAAVALKGLDVDTIKANLQSQDTLQYNDLTAHVADLTASLNAQTTQQISLLQAQVAENNNATDVAKTQINANAYVTIASLPYISVTQDLINKVNATASGVDNLQAQINTNLAETENVKNFGIDIVRGQQLDSYSGGGAGGPAAYTSLSYKPTPGTVHI